MPPPPPPGPPAPPPPGPGARSQPAFKPKTGGSDRSALLKSIQNGAQLKKTVTNDRSAPILGTVKNNSSANENSSRGGSGSSQTYGSNGSSNGPLPGIGGLFAGGMPTLKKTSGGVQTGRLTKLGQGEQTRVTNNFGNSKPLNSLSSSSLNFSSSGVSLSKPPPPPSNDKPSVPSPSPSSQSPRTKTIGPVHPASKPPPPPEPGHRPANPVSRSSKSFSQTRPSATIGPGPQSRTPLPMQQSVSRDDSSIQNGKLSNPPPPPVRTVSRAPPPPPTGKRPSQPPPPPPSGGRPPLRDLPPPPPPNHGQSMNGPPTPPTRRESIRKQETQPSSSESFELKFSGKFRSMQYLPPPELFSRCQKTYPSKTSAPVRQGSQLKRSQAPPPPPCKPPLPPGPPPARSWPATSVS